MRGQEWKYLQGARAVLFFAFFPLSFLLITARCVAQHATTFPRAADACVPLEAGKGRARGDAPRGCCEKKKEKDAARGLRHGSSGGPLTRELDRSVAPGEHTSRTPCCCSHRRRRKSVSRARQRRSAYVVRPRARAVFGVFLSGEKTCEKCVMLALFISFPSLPYRSPREHKQLSANAAIGQSCLRTPRVRAPIFSFPSPW